MMANSVALGPCVLSSSGLGTCPPPVASLSPSSCSTSSPQMVPLHRARPVVIRSQYSDNGGLNYFRFLRTQQQSSGSVAKAARQSSDWMDDSTAANGTDTTEEDVITPMIWDEASEKQQEGIVPFGRTSFLSLSQDVAMGLVLQAATATGWTTGSGLEGPAIPKEEDAAEEDKLKFPYLSKSPRRKMRVAFTCNVCGERTTRAINPHAYSDGTVFVQCKGCDVFHKLVDNLKLFHEMNGKIYRGYDTPWYANDQPYDFFSRGQYPDDDHFPGL